MKKYLRLFMAFMLVTMMTFSSTISAFAAEKENTLNATPILSQEQIMSIFFPAVSNMRWQ